MKARIQLGIDDLQRLLIYPLVAVLCAVALAHVHGSNIVENWHRTTWEDLAFFRYNSNEIHTLWDCFRKKGLWPGLYQPLTTSLYYYLGSIALGNRIEAYHFINLTFVILNAILLYRLATLFLGRWWAMVPPVLFVSRLAMVMVVTNTTEFQGLLCAFFTILSLDLFVRSRESDRSSMLAMSALAFWLAIFSKESAIVLPAILIVYGRLLDKRPALRPYLVHPMVALAWAILFVLVLRPLFHHQPTGFTYDLSLANLLRNYAAYFLAFSNWLLGPLYLGMFPPRMVALAGAWYVRLLFGILIGSEILLESFTSGIPAEVVGTELRAT